MTEPPDVPHAAMPTETLVMEGGPRGRQLLWIDGVLLLPIGARLELTGAATIGGDNADAVVTGVRVIAANADPGKGRPTLVLDVMLVAAGAAHDL